MDSYTQKLFSMGLGVEEPWYIRDLDFIEVGEKAGSRHELHVYVEFIKGSRFSVKGCDEPCPVYDTRERTWRHLNFFQYRCYVHAKVPRVRTPNGEIRTVAVPWGREGSGFTLMMEGIILTLCTHMPVRTVAREIGEQDTRLWRVIRHHVREALKEQDFSDVSAIGVDEYSHKGHRYITVFLSHPEVTVGADGRRHQEGKGRVLFVTEGKDKGAVLRFLERFVEKSGKPEEVKVVTSDMIHGFRNAVREAFPEAVVTVDKFHVVKNAEDMVDSVRRREMRSKDRRKTEALSGSRYMWLKNPENLTDRQRERLEALAGIEYLDTAKAYDMRLRVQHFYQSHAAYDEYLLVDFESLALDMVNCPIKEVVRFGELLTRNAVEILNYFKTFRTNAILEGFNSKISIIKNRARGFRNMENFMAMIYFVCGNLHLPLAPIM